MVSLVWLITGIILLGGMTAGGIRLWIKRRRESRAVLNQFRDTKIPSDPVDFEQKEKQK